MRALWKELTQPPHLLQPAAPGVASSPPGAALPSTVGRAAALCTLGQRRIVLLLLPLLLLGVLLANQQLYGCRLRLENHRVLSGVYTARVEWCFGPPDLELRKI